MSVCFDTFLNWANDRFGSFNVKVRNTAHGTEICTHSPWSEDIIDKTDRKFKLWMSCHGGKDKITEGVYRCWLTDKKGTLVELMSKWDGIPYEEAEEYLCGVCSIRTLEQKVHEFFGYKDSFSLEEMPLAPVEFKLPDFSYLIDEMSSSNFMKIRARECLKKRKIPTTGLYVCTNGDYKNRIIIPYYDNEGKLIWYNSRTMSDSKKILRYLKPPEGDQDKVIFMTSWPKKGSKVYVMEGEFDAKTLQLCGFIGCAVGGKSLSEEQINLIKDYQIVLAFDSDEAGLNATIRIGDELLSQGVSGLSYVRPPTAYKDWNKLFVQYDENIVQTFISRYEKEYNLTTKNTLMANHLF